MEFQPYASEGPKIWYSLGRGVPGCVYIRTLLQAKTLFAMGVENIPHDGKEEQYAKLLGGNVSVVAVQDVEDELPPNIDKTTLAIEDDCSIDDNKCDESESVDEEIMKEYYYHYQ